MSATSPSPPSSRPKRKANLGGSTVLGGMKPLQSRSPRKSHDPAVRPTSLVATLARNASAPREGSPCRSSAPLSRAGTLSSALCSSALGALHRPRHASSWRATQTRDSCSSRSSATLYSAALSDHSAPHTLTGRLCEAPCASSTHPSRLRVACLWREGRPPQPPAPPPRRLLHEHASSWHTRTFMVTARSSAPHALLGLTVPL